jgi:hypothetical protein
METTDKELVRLLRNDAAHKNHPTDLSFEHAQNLLALQVKKGLKHYSLPEDSKYEFKDGALNLKRSKTENRKAE